MTTDRIHQDFYIGDANDRKVVRYLSNDEISKYEKLGSAGGPLGIALYMGSKHCPDFFERVVGFRVSGEGIGKTINEAMQSSISKHPQAQNNMRLTYIFYGKKTEI